MANESRVLDSFGPNLVIETNGPVGVGGPIAYQIVSLTDKGAKWQQALHGSGLSSMEASHTLEIQTGAKNKKGQVSYMAMAHNGDMCMTTENGWIRIKGRNIVLDASNQILLQGRRVIVGNANRTTSETQIFGRKVVINADSEVVVMRSKKISKKGGHLFLKDSVSSAMDALPSPTTLISAFLPAGFGAKIKPGER